MTTQQRSEPLMTSSTLTNWAEEHIAKVFKAGPNNQAFDQAYDNLMGSDAIITVNGQSMSSADYKRHLRRTVEEGRTGAAVAFTGAVAVPQGKNDGQSEGLVGLFMHATLDEYMVLGAPETATVTASYNMRVAIHDKPGIYHGDADPDGRRVVAMSEVSVDRQHIRGILPPPPALGRQG